MSSSPDQFSSSSTGERLGPRLPIDHIRVLSLVHGRALRRVVRLLIFVLIRFHKSRHRQADHEGVKSGISTHLELQLC